MFELDGTTVLVTGASSGLGAHFARMLAGHGASVVLAARRVDALALACEEIRRAGGRISTAHQTQTGCGAPRGTTRIPVSWQYFRTAATCSTVSGNTTTNGIWR